MNPLESSIFSFSIAAIKSHMKAYFLFSPVHTDELKTSILNIIFLSIVLATLNFFGFLGAKLLNLNVLEVVYDIFTAIFVKSLLFIFVILFSLCVSLVYSLFLEDGTIRLSYVYMSLLSSIHLPLSLFLAYIKNSKDPLSLCTIVMVIQSLISDYLSRASVKYKEDEPMKNRISFILASLGMHLAFYALILRFLYSK